MCSAYILFLEGTTTEVSRRNLKQTSRSLQRPSRCFWWCIENCFHHKSCRKGAAPGRAGESFPCSADRYYKMKQQPFSALDIQALFALLCTMTGVCAPQVEVFLNMFVSALVHIWMFPSFSRCPW